MVIACVSLRLETNSFLAIVTRVLPIGSPRAWASPFLKTMCVVCVQVCQGKYERFKVTGLAQPTEYVFCVKAIYACVRGVFVCRCAKASTSASR